MNLDPAQRAAQEQFDRQSDRYGRSHILADVADLDAAVADVPLPNPGERALDVATGGGHTALWLARRGYRVTATDLAPGMLLRTSALLAEEGFLAEFFQHPAEDLPYPNATFAVVTCRVAAHHFSDPVAFLREVCRVLRPGGVFVLIDGTAPDELAEAAEWLHEVEKARDPSHGRFLTPATWRKLVRAAGLVVERCATARKLQPNLEWYFETAATSPENRALVRRLLAAATPAIRDCFAISEENGTVSWQWPIVHLVARRPAPGAA